jgi:uncharacterized protein (TIGR02996 family)
MWSAPILVERTVPTMEERPMVENEALLHPIIDAPENDGVRLVYADGLEKKDRGKGPSSSACKQRWICHRGIGESCYTQQHSATKIRVRA